MHGPVLIICRICTVRAVNICRSLDDLHCSDEQQAKLNDLLDDYQDMVTRRL